MFQLTIFDGWSDDFQICLRFKCFLCGFFIALNKIKQCLQFLIHLDAVYNELESISCEFKVNKKFNKRENEMDVTAAEYVTNHCC